MPIDKHHGDHLADGVTEDRQVPSDPTPKGCSPAIQLDRWYRNGLHPDANALNMMAEAANSAALHRSKQVFTGAMTLDRFNRMNSSAGERTRHRFAFRSGPYTHSLFVNAIIGAPDDGLTSSTKVRLDIYSDATETTLVSTRDFNYGVAPLIAGAAEGFRYVKVLTGYMQGISPDTDYYGKFTDVNYGRLFGVVVCELPSLTEYNAGYLAMNNTCLTPVVDTFRERLATITSNLWKKCGATVLTWSVSNGTAPVTTTSATQKNILDTSVTLVSAASPGFTLNMTGKDRVSQTTGVPVVMKVCAMIPDASVANGHIYLKDSTGTSIMSISNGWTGSMTSPKWVSATGVIPATTAKYDLHFSVAGGVNFKVYAVSIYEKD